MGVVDNIEHRSSLQMFLIPASFYYYRGQFRKILSFMLLA